MEGRVVYARLLDGETLWLAVRGSGALAVHGPGGSAPVAAETLTDDAGPLLSARVDAAALLDAGGSADDAALTFDLDGRPLAWDKEAAPGPTKVPPTRDGRWQLRLAAPDGALRVLRAALDPAVVVEGITGTGDDVVLRLRVTGPAELVSLDGEQVVGAVPVAPDGTARPDALPPGRLAVRADGRTLPVVRRDRDLRRPNFAVALPSTTGGRLQWQPDGRLVLAEESR